ncbi:MAG: hypothetical protein J6Z47_07610 [Bacteroidales bacterium]|nr:hypothetical protein [Bacteroidales bacterium]
MSTVAIIITIHDGDDRSSGSLEECQKQMEAIAARGKHSFSMFINNEGEAGCPAVWEKALEGKFDFYIWMDYGLRLTEGALEAFFENSGFLRNRAVIAGTVAGDDKSLLFGGRNKRGRLIEPDPTIPVPCYLYDLSLTMVPGSVVSSLDNPSDIIHRRFLDYGCGAKVAKAGIARVIAPGVLALTSRKNDMPVWKNPDKPLGDRILSFLKR